MVEGMVIPKCLYSVCHEHGRKKKILILFLVTSLKLTGSFVCLQLSTMGIHGDVLLVTTSATPIGTRIIFITLFNNRYQTVIFFREMAE